MKKLIFTLTATLACVAAFAQGRINFVNDSIHLVYFTSDTNSLRAGDAALAGTGPTTASALVADLFAGTSASSLTLQKSTTFSIVPGKWTAANTILAAGIPGGVPQFFQVQIHDAAAVSATAAQGSLNQYYGFGQVFTAVPNSGSIAYNSLTAHVAPANSTWNDGTFVMDQYGVGSRGAIVVQANVPEPTSFALAGLGAAALFIFRRRK